MTPKETLTFCNRSIKPNNRDNDRFPPFLEMCFLNSARLVFDTTLKPDLVSWTSILSSYCQCGENVEGLKIFVRSLEEGVAVNEFSCASVLGACASLENLKIGMQVHTLVIKCGLEFDNFVVTALINL